MPYMRRFYYIPRVNDSNKEVDIITPIDHSLLKPGGSTLDSVKNQLESSTRKQSFQSLSNEEQLKQLKFKQILGILNKMTPKKFQKLILQICTESVDLTYIKMLAELIFGKALDDEIYVHLYAKLCEELMSNLSHEALNCFRQVLLDLFQTGFDNILALTDGDIAAINEEKRYVYKRRLMTLMRFWGEMSCISEPLISREYGWELTVRLVERGDELHLEAAYFLLFTFALRSSDNAWPEGVWVTVAKLAKGIGPKGTSVSARLRFMFLSLVEARIGVMRPDPVPPPSTPPTSDSEATDQMPDLKGY